MKAPSLAFAIGTLSIFISAAHAQDDRGNMSVQNTNPAPTSETPLAEDLLQLPPVQMPVLPDEEVRDLLEQPMPLTDPEIITIEPTEPDQRGELGLGDVKRADVTKDPYRRGGKLFMTGFGTCSAQFVGANDVVMTAAHCVYNRSTGQWVSDVKFVRAYADGGGQTLGWVCMGIKNGWKSADPYPWDYAFIKVNGSSAAGALGLQTGLNHTQWTSIGYPGTLRTPNTCKRSMARRGAWAAALPK